MTVVFVEGNPNSEEEKQKLLEEAFDRFMQLPPLEQRRFLRKFGYTESEIDKALEDPRILKWEIRTPQAQP